MMTVKTKAMQGFISLALCLALPAFALPGHPEDAAFTAAREAFAKGDRARLANASSRLQSHPLVPWVQYFELKLRLDNGADTGVTAFLDRHEGSYLAEKLRGDWIVWLIKRENWDAARAQYARLLRPDADAQCRGLDVRLRLGEPEARDAARALLAAPAPLAEPCLAPLARLAAEGALAEDLLWQRLRQQLAINKPKEARAVAGWLPRSVRPAWQTLESIGERPARHIAQLPADFAATRIGREQAIYAVLRMARTEVHVAAARWREIENQLSAAERGFVWGRLAAWAALNHQAEATDWFDQAAALGAEFDEEQHAWRVRAALRSGNWTAVMRALVAMPETLAAQPDWTYWRARAHAAQSDDASARAYYDRIAGQPNFYGILATEALGRRHVLPARARPSSAEELAAATTNAGLQRGLALIGAGMRIEGVREWIWTINGMDDRQLLAAAEFARRHEVIDRSINTADRTRAEHDYALRYPTPFFDQVEPRAREVALDPAWVYGLMRQESRFITDAKSSVGAKGLMQLMPATAKWVARKIGMDHFHPAKVTDMDINVTLGTRYMKMVMDSLDNHPVLASAAYNAGPGRARRWRADSPLEGAIYAENIPFNETRDYVKKVLANAMNYALLMGGPTPALTQRLGTIRPRGFNDSKAEDLP